ncbi:transmembrane protein, putative (macronuclear) [Tetrahymena thermophila SB210]|uniref:Transmembrane protein, putative n=1 Tax=Tetrahymena thermophila (strain SB210) TaxID=312017 RepID=W7XJQ8_TETTS|nr:transmembrane protein, putative [Tetrahymena thermophila SB210]EWS75821.1 transmembrane protein, putative [Tetrahymena thermophila SB210]|eukprot:XP_012651635.1 transmembrane protein, putative [Tetrahymena thermophila SB210]
MVVCWLSSNDNLESEGLSSLNYQFFLLLNIQSIYLFICLMYFCKKYSDDFVKNLIYYLKIFYYYNSSILHFHQQSYNPLKSFKFLLLSQQILINPISLCIEYSLKQQSIYKQIK